MPVELFANDAQTTLNGAITSSATSLTVTSTTLFPAASSSATPPTQFRVKIDTELLIVTGVSGTTWTVTRGAESTTAAAHSNSAAVTHIVTAAGLRAVARPVHLLVTSSDASSDLKDRSDFVCDGTADDAEINAALGIMPAGGSKLELSYGRFFITSPILAGTHNPTISGAGTGQEQGAAQAGVGTRLEAASGLTGQLLLIQPASNTEPTYGALLRDFTIDGKNIGTAVDGIHVRSNRALLDHVHVHRATGNGIRWSGYTTPSVWDTYDSGMLYCQVGACGAAGVLYDTNSPDTHMTHCIIYDNAQDGVLFHGSSQQITGSHFYDNQRYNLFFDGNGARAKIVDCKIEGANQHGVNLDSTLGGLVDILFSNNGFQSNGDGTTNTYDDLIIQGANQIQRIVIVGNTFVTKSGTTNIPRYGINPATSQFQNSIIVGNSFDTIDSAGYGTGQINPANLGTTNIVRHNTRFVTEAKGTATVASGQTTIVVTHGLSRTPGLSDIQVTPTNNLGTAAEFWTSSPTATQFTINVNADPGAATATFAWQAHIL